ncbi:MAG TPA: hypothetical protein VGK71_05480 [Nitrospirota bacterium]
MKHVFALLSFFIITCITLPVYALDLPSGWRLPGEQDFYDDWERYSNLYPEPYHITADFDSDGLPDEAWILLRSRGSGWGLFVFMGGGGKPKQLIESVFPDAQFLAIRVANPGLYKVSREGGGVANLVLVSKAINLFEYQGDNIIFYWDGAIDGFKKAHPAE